jgi:hypothetical protein
MRECVAFQAVTHLASDVALTCSNKKRGRVQLAMTSIIQRYRNFCGPICLIKVYIIYKTKYELKGYLLCAHLVYTPVMKDPSCKQAVH